MDEDVDVSELSMDERIAILMDELPLPVQNFLKGPERDAVSLALTRKYNLHTDVAGVFERAYIFMLLGILTPEEFVEELREGGIEEETIKGLSTDVNELVFKKLRAEERGEVPPPASPPRPQVPVMEVRIKEETPPPNLPGQYAPPPPASISQPPINPAPIPPPAYAPSQIEAPAPQTPPIYSNPVPLPPSSQTYPAARTMAADMELAAQGYQGTPPTQYQAPSQMPYNPPPTPQPSAPSTPVPPPELSRAANTPPVAAPVRLTPVDRAHSNAPITKEYGSDPYREPIQ